MQNYQQESSMQPMLLNITQVAQILGLSRGKVYQLIREEDLPFLPIGRLKRVVPASLQVWVKQREEKNMSR